MKLSISSVIIIQLLMMITFSTLVCDSSCYTCSISPLNCTSCTGTLFFLNNTCVINSDCPAGTFPQSGTTVNICANCYDGCAICTGSSNTLCQGCKNNSQNVPYYLVHQSTICNTSCPIGQFIDHLLENECQSCWTRCYSCIGFAKNCTACTGTYYFINITNSTCVVASSCPSGTYGNTGTGIPQLNFCSACAAGCATCTGAATTNCQSCRNVSSTIYYLTVSGTTCSTTCPSGQFISSPNSATNNLCYLCDASCASCTNVATNCTSCTGSLYLLANACVSSSNCPAGTWVNTPSNQCSTCASGCATCTGAATTNCQSCQNVSSTIYYLTVSGTTCSTTCPSGQFISSPDSATNNLCYSCDASCATCTNVATNCTSCTGSLYLLANACVSSSNCPAGTWVNTPSNQCSTCASGCATCTGAATTNCQSCQNVSLTIYYLTVSGTTCSTTCPSGQFISSPDSATNNLCYLCDASCSGCSITATNCTSCTGILFLSSNSCVSSSSCSLGTWVNSASNICSTCASGCATCTGAGTTNCQSCQNVSSTIYYLTVSGTTCSTTCPSGQFISSPDSATNNLCYLCDASCASCTNVATNCTSCTGSLYLLANACVSSSNCPAGTWVNTPSNQCSTCASGCATCTGAATTNCQSCQNVSSTIYYLTVSGTTCSTTCPSGQFISSPDSATNNLCYLCDASCASCTNVATNCTSCTGILYLDNHICSSSCPISYWKSASNNTCVTCFDGCLICNGPGNNTCTQCTTALDGSEYYKYVGSNICNLICPDGQFIDLTLVNQCSMCNITCSTCVGFSKNCTTCKGMYFFFNNRCTASCPTQYWPSNGANNVCIQCSVGCLTCTGSGTSNCQSCGNDTNSVSYYKDAIFNICSQTCNVGQYINPTIQNVCSLCDVTCYTCNNTANFCTSCTGSLYLYQNTCISSCPDHYWQSSASNKCENCFLGCLKCYGSLNTQCFNCTNSSNIQYFKQNNSNICDTTCPSGQYEVTLSNSCFLCNPQCLTCATSPSNCFSCKNISSIVYNKYSSQNLCGVNCPTGEYINIITNPNVCLVCPSTCSSCNSTNCITCISNNYLDENKISCVSSCPISYYINFTNSDCQKCNSACNQCFGYSINNCTKCQNYLTINYFLLLNSNTCNQTCPKGQFGDISSFTCKICDQSCTQCSVTSNNCTFCTFDSSITVYLFNFQCVKSCPALYFNQIGLNGNSNICTNCFSGCLTCYNEKNSSCNLCTNVSNVIYYKWIGRPVCDTNCPVGSFISLSVPNFCQPCDISCQSCSISSNICNKCSLSYYYLKSNSTCSKNCPNNYYKTSKFLCQSCFGGCLVCFGPSPDQCNSCQLNSFTNTNYFKQIGETLCTTICKKGQFSDINTFSCILCDVGCSACQGTSSNCSSCSNLKGNIYYLFENNCVKTCPDLTLNNVKTQKCDPNCGNGYISQNGCVTDCPLNTYANGKNCISCGDSICLQNLKFKLVSLYISNNSLYSKVLFPQALAKNIIIMIKQAVLFCKLKNISRLLQESIIPLTIYNIQIAPDHYSLNIISSYQQIDFDKYVITVEFQQGLLRTDEGKTFSSTVANFSMDNPAFVSSYNNIVNNNIKQKIPGIITFIIGSLFLIIGFWNRRVFHEMLFFMQFLQIIGLLRYCSYPTIYIQYLFLSAFSFSQFNYVPNLFTRLMTSNYLENSYDIVAFVTGDHNFIRNIGSQLLIFMIIQFILLSILIYRRKKFLQKFYFYQELFITYFTAKTVFSCVLSFIGYKLNINTLISKTDFFKGSQAFAIIVFILYVIYYSFVIKNCLRLQLYKINILTLLFILPFFTQNFMACLVLLNLVQILFSAFDFLRYQNHKIDLKLCVLQRILMLFTYDAALLIKSELLFLVCTIVGICLVLLIKIIFHIIVYKSKKLGTVHPEIKNDKFSDLSNVSQTANGKNNLSQSNMLQNEKKQQKQTQEKIFDHKQDLIDQIPVIINRQPNLQSKLSHQKISSNSLNEINNVQNLIDQSKKKKKLKIKNNRDKQMELKKVQEKTPIEPFIFLQQKSSYDIQNAPANDNEKNQV